MNEIEFMDIFGDNLRDIMDECGFTQMSLACEAKLSKSTITRYLQKTRMPTLKAIVNLSLALDCSIDDLIPTYDYID